MCLPAKLNSVPGRVCLDDSRNFARLPMTALPGDGESCGRNGRKKCVSSLQLHNITALRLKALSSVTSSK